ncbi:hypothetical protein [Methylibium petroleiphilum]|uniref:hypothetical protein n=1 Tax=Methylibium petroleiphilum TaxID=105560 RepID=UPI00003CD5B5|nr:hypothetical protein [Methylibium petroleiphilum]
MVCSNKDYIESLPPKASRWLRAHADYDDDHPWEALDVVATLLGHNPPAEVVDEVRRAITRSFNYMELALDGAMKAMNPAGQSANDSQLGELAEAA